MYQPLLAPVRVAGAALAMLLASGFVATPAAVADDDDCRTLTRAERAELKKTFEDLGRQMERLGQDLARELQDVSDETDWQELATLGDESLAKMKRGQGTGWIV